MTTAPQPQPDELREFLLVVRQSLKMLIAYIERRYRIRQECPHCGGAVNKY